MVFTAHLHHSLPHIHYLT
ncbi:hypothetical protein E2C01_095029 [Portunus trituberculatus]|uniref:Uncharacterized protein n=1 Tax=Portunus trituberculatus TaxID=210409 RepID=A0A5B7JYX4_PORTR|nr:hypothetical protein [Portunus trituberculatus]